MKNIFAEHQLIFVILSTIFGAIMAIIVNTLRVKSAKKPVSYQKIIIPPLMMSTGLFMFVFPVFRITMLQALEAFVVGAIFSILLIRTTKFEKKDSNIYIIPSKAFIFILFGLLIIRLIGKTLLGQTIEFGEMTSMFFLLAFGMLLTWRLAMLIQFHQMSRKK